jgi:two-component system LytT family response regulator
MERLIVLDDRTCRKELDNLLNKHKKFIRLDTSSVNITNNLKLISESKPFHGVKEERLLINTANNTILIKIRDIIRCQSNRNYTELYLQNGSKLTVSKPLKQFAELKLLNNFARIHLSHLVNTDYIDRFIKSDGGSLLLTNGAQLPVSKRRRDEWLKKLEII